MTPSPEPSGLPLHIHPRLPARLQLLASSPWGRYGVAVLSTALALGLKLLLWDVMYPAPFLFFFAAVMLSGWWGGGGAGLLATALSALLADFFFMPPYYSLELQSSHGLALGLFVGIGALITWLNVAL